MALTILNAVRIALVAGALPLLGLPAAQAQDRSGASSLERIIIRTQLNKTECTCRLRGENLPVGSVVCMRDSMFRCQMNQNVTTWQPLATPCPQS